MRAGRSPVGGRLAGRSSAACSSRDRVPGHDAPVLQLRRNVGGTGGCGTLPAQPDQYPTQQRQHAGSDNQHQPRWAAGAERQPPRDERGERREEQQQFGQSQRSGLPCRRPVRSCGVHSIAAPSCRGRVVRGTLVMGPGDGIGTLDLSAGKLLTQRKRKGHSARGGGKNGASCGAIRVWSTMRVVQIVASSARQEGPPRSGSGLGA